MSFINYFVNSVLNAKCRRNKFRVLGIDCYHDEGFSKGFAYTLNDYVNHISKKSSVEIVKFQDLDKRKIETSCATHILISGADIPWHFIQGVNVEEYLEKYLKMDSGSQKKFSKDELLGFINPELVRNLDKILLNTDLPLLGVCGGAQRIYSAFNGKVQFCNNGSYDDLYVMKGLYDVIRIKNDKLFSGLEKTFKLAHLNYLEFASPLPPELELLAMGDMGQYLIVKHMNRDVYCILGHAETLFSPKKYDYEGLKLIRNFFLFCNKK